jgi:Tol biopolymer transport system component
VRFGVVAICATGCFFKPDAPGAAAGGGDGGPDALYPQSFGMFQNRLPLPIAIAGASDAGPSVSADGLDLYFYSERDPGGLGLKYRLWVTHRTDAQSTFGTPTWLNRDTDIQYDPTLMPDGLELYYFDENKDPRKLKRSSMTAAWTSDATILVPAAGPFAIGNHGLSMVASTMPHGDPSSEIVELTRSSTAMPWLSASSKIDVHHTASDKGDSNPTLSADGRELWWQHEYGDGGVQIFYSFRADPTGTFPAGTVQAIAGVSSTAYGDPEISSDGTDLYFSMYQGTELKLFVTHRDPS